MLIPLATCPFEIHYGGDGLKVNVTFYALEKHIHFAARKIALPKTPREMDEEVFLARLPHTFRRDI